MVYLLIIASSSQQFGEFLMGLVVWWLIVCTLFVHDGCDYNEKLGCFQLESGGESFGDANSSFHVS